MSNLGRLNELDALRGLAALAVVLYHYTTRYEAIFGHAKTSYFGFNYGNLGVNLFFMISGFVIFMTITRTNNVTDFAKKRIIRLYPSYIVAVIITFVAVKLYDLGGRGVTLFDGVFNLTMLQGFLPGVIDHVDGAYWSLKVELTFYIIIGVILFFGLKQRVYLLSILWLISTSIFQVLDAITGGYIITKALVFYSIADYAHLFIAGIMFYLLKTENQLKYHLLIGLCLIYEFALNDSKASLFVTMFFGVFYLLINGKLSLLNNKILTFLGAISYSLYLIHQNIGYIIINFMENNGLTNEVYLIIPLLISISLATLLTYSIEKPSLKYFKNKTKLFNNDKSQKPINA
ncbi:acyltransferase family protein [Mesobacillus zeae]|uniref:acyltransferase family protein n=1 Tax=Mesobacillus zeae TaxID=1917180 RepID=UPI003008335E